MSRVPIAGVGVMIIKDGAILLGRRKNADGAGEYAFPGGRLEFGESFEECARREVAEETGLEIADITFQFVGNLARHDMHYVHAGMVARWVAGEPQVMEPDKSEAWAWYRMDALPSPVYVMCVKAVESYRTKQSYFGTLT